MVCLVLSVFIPMKASLHVYVFLGMMTDTARCKQSRYLLFHIKTSERFRDLVALCKNINNAGINKS